MKSGYDKFFKAAQSAKGGVPRTVVKKKPQEFQVSEQDLQKMFKVAKQKKRKKDVVKVPWLGLGFSFLSVLWAALYISDMNPLDILTEHIDINVTSQASASDPTAAKPAETKKPGEAKAATTADAAQEKADKNPVSEDLSFISKLTDRKKELDAREQDLNQLEEELQRQRVEVEQQIKQLEGMRRELASVLNERVQIDEEKVNKLVEVYSSMKPKQAAEVLSAVNEDLAIEVLVKMKKKDAAAVLDLIDSKKAQALSEKYTGYFNQRK